METKIQEINRRMNQLEIEMGAAIRVRNDTLCDQLDAEHNRLDEELFALLNSEPELEDMPREFEIYVASMG